MLTIDDFDGFFRAVHAVDPFPWQRRLLRHVAQAGSWPRVLDLPTASGKTAAMDVALFHLALDADKAGVRRAPVRIAFVVDRRLVVDDAFARAERIARALEDARDDTLSRVAGALRRMSDGPALITRRLRGGVPCEDDWARSPTQPVILCSTVDQVGSRLLFRGYGVSDAMKPVHAGLLGSDCLILLDEAHLAAPFRQTLDWVETYRGRPWREVEDAAPWGVALLTATPGADVVDAFGLDDDDRGHPVLRSRLAAPKPTRLVVAGHARGAGTAVRGSENDTVSDDSSGRVEAIVVETRKALDHFAEASDGNVAIGVVVNRVARARAVHAGLVSEHPEADVRLIIGPARPVEREGVARDLAPIRTGVERKLDRPLLLVATQCIEAGVDIDLDGLITEAASLDALRQRFGRLNRAGRPVATYAAVIVGKGELSPKYEDPVYGTAISHAWSRLAAHAAASDQKGMVDFGVNAFSVPLEAQSLSPHDDAPVLMPAHLDLLGQTSPPPMASPEVGVFLHGARREPDAVMVVWRADVEETDPVEGVRRLLLLAPPRAAEAIELPVWTVRRWLLRVRGNDHLADTASSAPDEADERRGDGQRVFRWKGDDDGSCWVRPREIRPGDMIVVPASFGGVDEFGWDPEHTGSAKDVGAAAARPFADRRLAIRIAPGLVGDLSAESLAEALRGAESLRRWAEFRPVLMDLDLPEEVRSDVLLLDHARGRPPLVCADVYPPDAEGGTRGVVLLAPLGVEVQTAAESHIGATEDDLAGSLSGSPVGLTQHCADVAVMAEAYADRLSLPVARRTDLKVAGWLHDAGKVDARFQAWLHFEDPLGPDLAEPDHVLAKSGRALPRRAHKIAGLPHHWRHEALSVRLAPLTRMFAETCDAELVLWLIGSHHGRGRPFFPHDDPADASARELPQVLGLPDQLAPGPGPQTLAYDWNGADWPSLYARLVGRYGLWELARMEAILRLADHRASEVEAVERSRS